MVKKNNSRNSKKSADPHVCRRQIRLLDHIKLARYSQVVKTKAYILKALDWVKSSQNNWREKCVNHKTKYCLNLEK